jgi:hypothetical protein
MLREGGLDQTCRARTETAAPDFVGFEVWAFLLPTGQLSNPTPSTQFLSTTP